MFQLVKPRSDLYKAQLCFIESELTKLKTGTHMEDVVTDEGLVKFIDTGKSEL